MGGNRLLARFEDTGLGLVPPFLDARGSATAARPADGGRVRRVQPRRQTPGDRGSRLLSILGIARLVALAPYGGPIGVQLAGAARILARRRHACDRRLATRSPADQSQGRSRARDVLFSR